MNLALPAFFTFLVILPGFIFTSSYYTIGSSQLKKPPLGVRTAVAISVSLGIHLMGTAALGLFAPEITVDYELVSAIYSPNDTESVKALFNPNILPSFALYLLATYLFAGLLGPLIRTFVLATNLDRAPFFERLRFTSDFAYVALGRELTLTQNTGKRASIERLKRNLKMSDVDQVDVEVVTTLGTELIYYTGVLKRVDYSPNGEPCVF